MTNEQIVYTTALNDGMPQPLALIIVAQAKHESGNFTSAIFTDCNNAFGYKVFGNAAPCPSHPDYEFYPSLADSVHEITGWIKRRLNAGNFPALNTITDPGQYAALLQKNGYFTDSLTNYSNGLYAWYQPNINAGISGTVILAGIALLLIIRKK